ncbi:hypothetical protein PRNP1_002203 [Phytophthora ramorum]
MAPRASADMFTATREPAMGQHHLHGMLLTWDSNLLAAFIDAANTEVPVEFPNLDQPTWLTDQRGRLTAQGFVEDTMTYLAQSAGGYHDTTLSPLTPMQSSHLSRTMGQIEMHPFIQACARKLPEGRCLISGTIFFQDPVTDGVPTNLPSPPSPHRQIFI